MKPLLKTIALFWLVAAPVSGLAAPAITSFTGVMVNGSTFTIFGTDFLDKSPAAPYLWADFSGGTLAPNSLGLTTSFSGVQNVQYTGSSYVGGGVIASNNTGNWTLGVFHQSWTLEGRKVYMFKNLRRNFLITSATQNFKTWRMWAADNRPNMYTAASNGSCTVEFVGDASGSCGSAGFFSTFNNNSTSWVSEEILFQASSAPDLKDGSVRWNLNGQQRASGSVRTRSLTCNAADGGDYMTLNYIFHEVLANKSGWSPAWQDTWRSEGDNFYIDMTLARLMLGNASTYSACTKVEPQIPTTWTGASGASVASFVANTAGFSNGAAYLYLFDKNGLSNSSGFAVTVGSATNPNPPPSLDSVSPSTGSTLGNDTLVLAGNFFSVGAVVTIAGSPATNVLVVNSQAITFSSPSGTAGAKTLTIQNPDGQNASTTFTFLQASPTVTAVTPSTVFTTGTERIEIDGTSFLAGSTVSVSGSAATSVSVLTSTAIICSTPAKSAGTYDVTVSSNGLSGTKTNGIVYGLPPPTLASITPSSGTISGGTLVDFNVTNAVTGCQVQFGTMTAITATFVSSTLVRANSPAGPNATVIVKIINPDAKEASLNPGFTYFLSPTPPGLETLPWAIFP